MNKIYENTQAKISIKNKSLVIEGSFDFNHEDFKLYWLSKIKRIRQFIIEGEIKKIEIKITALNEPFQKSFIYILSKFKEYNSEEIFLYYNDYPSLEIGCQLKEKIKEIEMIYDTLNI